MWCCITMFPLQPQLFLRIMRVQKKYLYTLLVCLFVYLHIIYNRTTAAFMRSMELWPDAEIQWSTFIDWKSSQQAVWLMRPISPLIRCNQIWWKPSGASPLCMKQTQSHTHFGLVPSCHGKDNLCVASGIRRVGEMKRRRDLGFRGPRRNGSGPNSHGKPPTLEKSSWTRSPNEGPPTSTQRSWQPNARTCFCSGLAWTKSRANFMIKSGSPDYYKLRLLQGSGFINNVDLPAEMELAPGTRANSSISHMCDSCLLIFYVYHSRK